MLDKLTNRCYNKDIEKQKGLIKMANKKMEWYLENDDFEGAYERWKTTSPSWKKRWFDVCEKIYSSSKEWVKTYVLNPVEKVINKITDVREIVTTRIKKEGIAISNDCNAWDDSKGLEKCYLIAFFNEQMELVCSKVGTTTRSVFQRIREELNSKTYKGMGATHCVINRVYDCGNLPAEGVESMFRAKYIKKYPNSFYKNDRFISEHFDMTEADKFFAEYVN